MEFSSELQREEEQRRAAEQRARSWLKEVLPLQAEIYEKFNFIEVPSKLYKGRTYRIHGGEGDFRTSLYQNGKKLARLCLMMLDPEIPPTDRVIAEYYLLQGDEQQYLATANIQNLVPESRAGRLGSLYGLSGGHRLAGSDGPASTAWGRVAIKIVVLVAVGMLLVWLGRSGSFPPNLWNGAWVGKISKGGSLLAFFIALAWLIYAMKRHRPAR